MTIRNAKGFSLAATIESGQVFRYSHSSSDDFYHVVAGDTIVKVRQRGNQIECECSSRSFDVKKFLGLNHDYGRIIRSISKDGKIAAAIRRHYGLRLIGQEPWECTASFIISAFSNIPRIRKCLNNVAEAFGSRISLGGFAAFSFPKPQQISSFPKLRKCGLGYRAKYLFETARIFVANPERYSRQQLRKLGYAAAKERLTELPGVGGKVADCVLLFSCGFYEAFPVDVWVMRTMQKLYGNKITAAAKRANEKAVGGFARGYFGKYAGYAQQFLYHYARNGKGAAYKSKSRLLNPEHSDSNPFHP